jgi:hypothetical protein
MACCCPSLLADAKHLREAGITRGKVRLAFAPHAHGLELCDLGVRKRLDWGQTVSVKGSRQRTLPALSRIRRASVSC